MLLYHSPHTRASHETHRISRFLKQLTAPLTVQSLLISMFTCRAAGQHTEVHHFWISPCTVETMSCLQYSDKMFPQLWGTSATDGILSKCICSMLYLVFGISWNGYTDLDKHCCHLMHLFKCVVFMLSRLDKKDGLSQCFKSALLLMSSRGRLLWRQKVWL